MTDHYELFGVDPDATKDEIKAAYRSEVESADSARRAQLNRAWNVLSDPIQRQRYDETLAADGDDESDEGDSNGGAVVIPSRRTTGARRGPESTVLETNGAASNGSAKNGSGGGGKGGGGGSGDGAPSGRPEPVELPNGLVQAPAKARSLAMTFDLAILVVIFLAVQFAGVAIIKNQYPAQVDQVDALVKRADRADKAKTKADDAKDKADSALSDAKKKGSSAEVSAAQDKADAATATAKAADKRSTDVNDELVKAQDKLRPQYLAIQGVVLVFALLYCVPMSVRSGQTLGKRLRKVRLVRTDGSAPGWSSSLIHYGVPVFLTLALVNILGPIALILGLGSVLWNIRDRNRQGIHDKLAKTYVVEA
jgi:curved DNA-binding protein CbpA